MRRRRRRSGTAQVSTAIRRVDGPVTKLEPFSHMPLSLLRAGPDDTLDLVKRPSRSPTARRWFDARLLIAGLALVVVALTLLAYWAWQASLRRHAVAIELLRSHAELAAQRLGARIQAEIYVGATAVFRPVTGGRLGIVASLPQPEAVLAAARDAERCRCVAPFKPMYAARTDLTPVGTRFAGPDVPPAATQGRLIDTLRAQMEGMPRGWEIAILRGAVDGRIAVFTRVASANGPAGYLLLATDSARFREFVVRPLLANTPLVVGDSSAGMHNDSLVSIRIATTTGDVLYRSATALDSATSSATRFPIEWGELTITASLLPKAAAFVLPGGVPRSPLPTLIGLLLIATALVAGASMLIWRMYELARLRTDFTSSVSHELRTPLTQILLYAETIEMGRHRSEEKRAEAIGVIAREARRLIHLVENVLHYSRAERNLTRLDARTQDLGSLVADTVGGFTPVAEARGSTVALRIPQPVHARVDGDALRRVVLNLLDNAIRYGPAGQRVVVGVERDGPWARIIVEDDGPGVPLECLDEIWRPFVRLDAHDGDDTTGCGIGLAIVSEIVALHGGRRGVRSRLGGGAAFYVELPAATADAAPAPDRGDHGARPARARQPLGTPAPP